MNVDKLFKEQPILETERLRLRPLVFEDFEEVLEIYSDDVAGQFNCWTKIDSKKDSLLRIMQFHSQYNERQRIRWGITLKDTTEVIGDCAFVAFDFRADRAEIGFNLIRKHWNKGYMTEALTALLKWGFEMSINRIEAVVSPDNAASRAVLKKLGFTEEALLRKLGKKDSEYFDCLMIALLKEDSKLK